MNQEEFLNHASHLHDRCYSMLKKKGNDYADIGNAFSNFMEAARDTDITTEQGIRFMIAIKKSRIKELLGGKTAQNESLLDSIEDSINYFTILHAFITYLNKKKEQDKLNLAMMREFAEGLHEDSTDKKARCVMGKTC